MAKSKRVMLKEIKKQLSSAKNEIDGIVEMYDLFLKGFPQQLPKNDIQRDIENSIDLLTDAKNKINLADEDIDNILNKLII